MNLVLFWLLYHIWQLCPQSRAQYWHPPAPGLPFWPVTEIPFFLSPLISHRPARTEVKKLGENSMQDCHE